MFLTGRAHRALLLLQHHRPSDAEKELRGHLAEEPSDVDALLLLSVALTQQDKHVDAVAVAHEALALAPDRPAAHHYLAKALFHKGDTAKARNAAEDAIRLDPEDADHFGVLALALNHLGEHGAALKAAEQGLALDPEHLTCLNVRSIELSLVKRYAEADSAISKALELDPENPYTHSNTGWAVLRRGDHRRAMEHFREALRREPGMEHARQGMIEALKARYWIYRAWLKYVFWVGQLRPGSQRLFIFGIWLVVRFIGAVAQHTESLRVGGTVLTVAYVLFALSTWVIEPLTNLLLRFNRFGRYLLDREQKLSSTLTGLSVLIGLSSACAWIALDDDRWIAPGVFGLLMMVPLASMFRKGRQDRKTRIIAAVALAVTGCAGSVIALGSGEPFNIPIALFAVGAILYQWILALFPA